MSVPDLFITVECRPCPACHEQAELVVPLDPLHAWQTRKIDIQTAFPDMDADTRELLISGTHAACWDRLFGGSDAGA